MTSTERGKGLALAIALLSLGLSVTTLIWTIWHQRSEQRRWALVNEGDLVYVGAAFRTFGTYDAQELDASFWGVPVELVSTGTSDGRVSNTQIFLLAAFDPATAAPIPGLGLNATLADLEQSLSLAGRTMSEVEVRRQYRIDLSFENKGNTTIHNIQVGPIRVFEPAFNPGKWISLGNAGLDEFSAHTRRSMPITLTRPSDKPLPPQLRIYIPLNYERPLSGSTAKAYTLIYDQELAYWSFEQGRIAGGP